MKRFTIFLLLLVITLGTLAGAVFKPKIIDKKTFAEEVVEYQDSQTSQTTQDNTLCLSIIGSASKCVTPDQAKVTGVIETIDIDVIKAKDTNTEIFEKVCEKLQSLGLEKGDIILESFTCYPNYDYTSGKSLVGYNATTAYTFKVSNLDKINDLIDGAIECGSTCIRNINYELSNQEEVYQEVLMMAVENAKEKAIMLTGNEEISIKAIKEEYIYSCSSLYRSYSDTISDTSLIGEIEIEAKVNVEF